MNPQRGFLMKKLFYKIQDRQEFRTMRDNTGFTLIELMVVIVLIATLTAISIPNFLAYLPNASLKSAARELYSNLQLAKMGAIKNNTNCTITFSAPGTYAISGAMTETVALADYGYGVTFDGPSNETFDEASIAFNSRGIPSDDGYAYLSNAANTRYYRVGLLTSGVIKLEQSVGGSWE
jgi:prepilin-type N-terminal cleavage/methylation domain-containing protein